ncbi:hypothetical protein ACFLZY_02615 [Patescibacteria group bacterium]
MEFSIKNLLNSAVSRANIGHQVKAAQLLAAVNNTLGEFLPIGRHNDAQAQSFKSSTVMIACLNSSVAQFIKQNETEILDKLKSKNPEGDICGLKTKIVAAFPRDRI